MKLKSFIRKLALIALLFIFIFFFPCKIIYSQLKPFAKLQNLEALKSGNERFIVGKLQQKNFTADRADLLSSQSPYAIIVTCSDSRVVPEYIFDEDFGKLFVIRIAGNAMSPEALGSVEFAATYFKCKMLIIMGHENCGAMITAFEGKSDSPNINAIRNYLRPAVNYAKSNGHEEKEQINLAIEENVKQQIRNAMDNSQIIRKLTDEGNLTIFGAVYSISTGKVDFLNYSYNPIVKTKNQERPKNENKHRSRR